MKKFRICDDIFKIFPEVCLGIVIAKNIDNNQNDMAIYSEMLLSAERSSLKHVPYEPISANPIIAEWREVYRKFPTKKGARSSVEALLKRAKQGHHINSISPIVDIYNSISLTYSMSCGAEDIDTFSGDLLLTISDGTESFSLIGSEENEPPIKGEIIYKDDAGAVCRCFNWRESKRTMITENSKNAFLSIELVNQERIDELEEAIKKLAGLICTHLHAKTEYYILTRDNPEALLE